jgi:hypothetical protein
MESLVKTRRNGESPYHRLDSVWMSRVRRSGWQGWTLLAGGDDVMDQSILFWHEGRGNARSLSLTLRVRQASDRKVRDHLTVLPGLDVYRGSIPYPRKQVVAGEIHPLDREWSLIAGTALDAQVDSNIRLRYLPYEPPGDDSIPYSAQGCLTLTLDRAHGNIDEVTSMLIVLSQKLGIDTRLSSAADLEYLYLRKMGWAMRLDLASFDHDPPADRLGELRAEVSRALGVSDVTRLPEYNWEPKFSSAYNPWTSAIGTGEAGWPRWQRFDAQALEGPLGRRFLGHDLAAHAPNVGDRVARLFRSTGHLLSAEERWLRLGTPSQSIHMPHGQWGGGTYLPLRLLDDDRSATLVFDIQLLKRVDHIALSPEAAPPPPAGGEAASVKALSPQSLEERVPLERLAETHTCDVYFKRSISLMDALVRINLDKDLDRLKVLDALRVVGVQRIRGRAVDEIVRVRGGAS